MTELRLLRAIEVLDYPQAARTDRFNAAVFDRSSLLVSNFADFLGHDLLKDLMEFMSSTGSPLSSRMITRIAREPLLTRDFHSLDQRRSGQIRCGSDFSFINHHF